MEGLEIMEAVAEAASEIGFGIWFLIGAAMVFFMQAGFAMVEAGFTRAKNAANIIMKNLMDFSIGTICFIFLGYALMMGVSSGWIGLPNLDIITNYAEFDFSDFVFNLVFCATAATIVSGAMAERTKFSAYIIYTIFITAIIYPIQAGWVWNENGWLANLGFIDFAGSAAIHMVGGICAFIGAVFLGPRIGKYSVDKATGKKTVHAIPGHSLTLGALGCFILWFGWYGFNGAAAGSVSELGSIFVTTTIAAASAAVSTMTFTWIKNGKPDVSMSLNGALAGLVGITAGCANLSALGALIVGLVAGVLVVIAVEGIDKVLHVDDPVGAVAVHGVCGIWGALAVGLFATDGGLFYGGGASLFGIQALGVGAILLWTTVTITIAFIIIKALHGLRASKEDEIAGLDSTEHGLASSYADFISVTSGLQVMGGGSEKSSVPPVSPEAAIPVTNTSTGKKLTKVTIITRASKFDELREALDKIEITGLTVTSVMGYGIQRGHKATYRGVPLNSKLLPKIKVDIVISKVPVDLLIKTVKSALYTGNIGDGKIFVYDVENVVRVRTGEQGYDALQDTV